MENLGNSAWSGDFLGGLVVVHATWGEMVLDPIFRNR